ncbi:amino acid permease [Flavihumibacter rivuli]|uniref:APC family permease n=1 Tax=Flavihumibacter rivuli TaxID=2838156 RepID=UPI001BDE550C|nr:amino acid permease [Flavihumibacter rivuli]ULQ56222.1 amino acid permease [Flavihumibacter rivuli]
MPQLSRSINIRTTIAIVVGGIIGSGVFMKPSLMLSQLGSPWALVSVWVLAGFITLFGALSNAEIAAMYPETGGPVVFFQKIYGDAFSFLYGWAAFAVFNTAGNASIAYVFAEYSNYFFHLPRFSPATERLIELYIPFIGKIYPLANIGVKLLTIFILALLTWVNYRSVQMGGALQRILTALKAVAIALLIGGVLTSGKGDWGHFGETVATNNSMGWLGAYIAALSGAFWGYDGWNNINFIAGEVKDPQRTIPRSLLLGLMACIIIYALVNVAYVYAMPVAQMAGSTFVAADAATMVWGGIGGSLITLLVMLSTFGSANACVFSTARVTYAMGKDNAWFAWMGKAHPRYNTPGNALVINGIWSALMVFTASFDMLTDMLVFVSWFFYGMSALGVFILRFRFPNKERIYKVPGYPWVPLVFVIFTFFFLCLTLYQDIINYQSGKSPLVNSLFGLLITCIGIPIFYASRKSGEGKGPQRLEDTKVH